MIFFAALAICALIKIFFEGVHNRYIEGIVTKKLSSSDIKDFRSNYDDYYSTGPIKSPIFVGGNSWGTIWINDGRYFFKKNEMDLFRKVEIGQKLKVSVSNSNRVLKVIW